MSFTFGIKSIDGTVSEPGYTWAQDPDTGLYRIGANNMGVAVAGANILDISAAGVLGTRIVRGTGATVADNFNTTATPFGAAGIRPLRAGSVTGVALYVHSDEGTRDAGTLTAEVRKNGSGIGLVATIDGTNTSFHAATQNVGTDTFSAGDLLDILLTGATFSVTLPTAGFINIRVDIEYTG